jgi:hypothetical protein
MMTAAVTVPDPGGVGCQRLYTDSLRRLSDLSGSFSCGRLSMPKKSLWLIILFTAFFIIGVNLGDITYLLNLGTTICLSCIGVG